MNIETKPIDQITEADLLVLIAVPVPAGKRIEYKRELPTDAEDKRKLLAAVSSLANTEGGHLICGMADNKGVPVDLCGLQLADADKEILRISQMIDSGCDPKIRGVHIQPVPLKDRGIALVIRVPRSWNAPHMLVARPVFYNRGCKGKRPLDAHELRMAFIGSESRAEHMRQFRLERTTMLLSDEAPIPVQRDAKTVILTTHVMPATAFESGATLSLSGIHEQHELLRLVRPWGSTNRYNFDGLVVHPPVNENGPFTGHPRYLQLFRNGVVESVQTHAVGDPPVAYGGDYEYVLVVQLRAILSMLKQLEVDLPLTVLVSVLNTKGVQIIPYENRPSYSQGNKPIDRDKLIIPPVLFESFNQKPEAILRPVFDAIWNASGWAGSINYTEKGEWQLKTS
jgi:hypothetical protein